MTGPPGAAHAAGTVRTVLGDVPAGDLGRVDYHEHFFQRSPLLPGEDLDDEELSGREAVLLRRSGFEAVVDATPLGLGRDAPGVARISRASGLAVVLTTGAHRSAHYPPGHPVPAAPSAVLARRFTTDLVEGAAEDLHGGAQGAGEPAGAVRAGVLKVGIDYWRIDGFAHRVVEAVAAAHERTGAPVVVHLEHGSAAHEVLDLLGAAGVAPARVALAHVDRNPDPGLHVSLAERGAYLGYDGAARHRTHPDSVLLDCLSRVVEAGAGARVLLGGDVARRSRYVAYGGMPGLAYLGERFVPRLQLAVGAAAVDAVLRDNPARWLTWVR